MELLPVAALSLCASALYALVPLMARDLLPDRAWRTLRGARVLGVITSVFYAWPALLEWMIEPMGWAALLLFAPLMLLGVMFLVVPLIGVGATVLTWRATRDLDVPLRDLLFWVLGFAWTLPLLGDLIAVALTWTG